MKRIEDTEETRRRQEKLPWRVACRTAVVPRFGDATFDLCAEAMVAVPEDGGFVRAREKLEQSLNIEKAAHKSEFVPSLLVLHMLYNWTPSLFNDLVPCNVFFHTEWLRRAREASHEAQSRAAEFFSRAKSTPWGLDSRAWRCCCGGGVIVSVPAALLNAEGFWFDVVKTDMSNAVGLWEQSSALSFPPSMNSLAVCLSNAEGVTKDEDRAMELFEAAAEQGHANTLRNLGWTLHEHGDREKAVVCFREAAQRGHAPALVDLSTYAREGLGGETKSIAESVRLLRCAADQGEPWAQTELGFIHEEGNEVIAVDFEAAARFFELAAAQDLAEGELRLARCLANGVGLEANQERSIALLKSAARKGHQEAAFALGLFLWASGQSIEAARALSRCLNNGDPDIVRLVADMHIPGLNIPRGVAPDPGGAAQS